MTKKRGGQPGNNNASKGKEATTALFQALSIESGDRDQNAVISRYKALVDIWRAQIKKAIEGDTPSATMIVDRLEGKPKQAVIGGDDEDPPIRITRIELVPLNDDSQD